MRVGFIGLGSQGGPMARRIVEGGYETTLWARREASLEPYADTAAKTAGSPAELAAASDLVCVCVVGDDDVRQVLYGETGVLAAGWSRFTARCIPTHAKRSLKRLPHRVFQ
jgi:3-hydroxyisobutyrate dehydrogenase-like beta-hydroxyacid dehydrogenase